MDQNQELVTEKEELEEALEQSNTTIQTLEKQVEDMMIDVAKERVIKRREKEKMQEEQKTRLRELQAKWEEEKKALTEQVEELQDMAEGLTLDKELAQEKYEEALEEKTALEVQIALLEVAPKVVEVPVSSTASEADSATGTENTAVDAASSATEVAEFRAKAERLEGALMK